MLRAVPMVHLRVQIPNRDAAAATRAIAREGVLHLVDIGHGRIARSVPSGAQDLYAAFRDTAARLRAIMEKLDLAPQQLTGKFDEPEVGDYEKELEVIRLRIAPIEKSVEQMARQRSDSRHQIEEIERQRRFASLLASADVDLQRIRAARFVSLRLGLSTEENLLLLESLLAPGAFAIVPVSNADDRVLAAVAAPISEQSRLESALRLIQFELLPLPESAEDWKPERLEQRLAQARSDLAAAEEKRSKEGQSQGELLQQLLRRAEVGTLLLQAQTHFAAAGKFVVISGWIPEQSASHMREVLLAATQERAVVEIHKPEELHEVSRGSLKVPILHRNPLVLRPFQKLIDVYGAPSYSEVQPTAFFAVSFLLMFGLMFGDVGHGLVLFSAGYLLFRYFPRFLDYGILLMEGGAASAFFGILYGSVFGIEGLLPVLWLRPMQDLSRFLTVALLLGVSLVSLGLILNVINTWRSGSLFDALLGPRGLFGAFVYWVLVVILARAVVPGRRLLPPWILLVLLGIGIALLALRGPITRKLERVKRRDRAAEVTEPGWLGALEASVDLVDTLFAYFANTISFVRIAAFAAVHAGVFLAIFAVADTLAEFRFGGFLAIVTYVAGNAVVILLEGLTVSVQVLRLEYYEFFSKFFRGGGEPYKPLMLRINEPLCHAERSEASGWGHGA